MLWHGGLGERNTKPSGRRSHNGCFRGRFLGRPYVVNPTEPDRLRPREPDHALLISFPVRWYASTPRPPRTIRRQRIMAARRGSGTDARAVVASAYWWLWGSCGHRVAVALVPFVIRWGADASSDVLREHVRCAAWGDVAASVVGGRGDGLGGVSGGVAVARWRVAGEHGRPSESLRASTVRGRPGGFRSSRRGVGVFPHMTQPGLDFEMQSRFRLATPSSPSMA
jgi:hypothetical protein